MCMSTTSPPAPSVDGRKRGPGRPARYGGKAIQRHIYGPQALMERLQHEARVRNILDNTDTWNLSSVVVADMAQLYDIDLQSGTSDGQPHAAD